MPGQVLEAVTIDPPWPEPRLTAPSRESRPNEGLMIIRGPAQNSVPLGKAVATEHW